MQRKRSVDLSNLTKEARSFFDFHQAMNITLRWASLPKLFALEDLGNSSIAVPMSISAYVQIFGILVDAI